MADTNVSPDGVIFALAQIKDGGVFEQFGQELLAKVLGYEFLPVGGMHDRGIDGLESTYTRTGMDRAIYQFSIRQDYLRKMRTSLETLLKNHVQFRQFVYVTNIVVAQKDRLIDDLVAEFGKAVTVYDASWFAVHIGDSEATRQSFQTFVESYLHEFSRPGTGYMVADLEHDPRVCVFLRGLVDERARKSRLDSVVADALVLFSLEDTDPDAGRVMTRDEIVDSIAQTVKFDIRLLKTQIDTRLHALSSKPRRISYHTQLGGYCLTHEERMSIANRNLAEASLAETFERDTLAVLRLLCSEDELDAVTCLNLVRDSLHAIFREQGLEFADMILQGTAQRTVLEKSLPDVIATVVEQSGITEMTNGAIRNALLVAIRAMVYSGTTAQRTYLDRLSRTYMMLFLLQCDPRVVAFFGSMAAKLNIYVGTSILIPALSEQFLDQSHRRYTNLLLRASKAGVRLRCNEPILRELAAHFRLIDQVYREQYQSCEAVYLAGDFTRYVDRIMLRAYFHARDRDQVGSFHAFVERFVSPDLRSLSEDLVSFLDSALGVKYEPNTSRGIRLNPDEVNDITTVLVRHKLVQEKAKTDAQVLLTVHAVREMNNEIGTGGLAGYRTWWLTSDISTQRAAQTLPSQRYSADCYMRPDFLYNFVSFAPQKGEADDAFRSLLPSLLGVNISFHLPDGAAGVIHSFVVEHQQKDPARACAVIRQLSDRAKHDESLLVKEHLVPFLEQSRHQVVPDPGTK